MPGNTNKSSHVGDRYPSAPSSAKRLLLHRQQRSAMHAYLGEAEKYTSRLPTLSSGATNGTDTVRVVKVSGTLSVTCRGVYYRKPRPRNGPFGCAMIRNSLAEPPVAREPPEVRHSATGQYGIRHGRENSTSLLSALHCSSETKKASASAFLRLRTLW